MRTHLRRTSSRLICLLLGALLVAGCSPVGPDPLDSGETQPIAVADVRVEVGVGSPIPVDVLVSGTWPELCSQLAEVRQSIEEGRIEIALLATPPDAQCPPDHLGVPFRMMIPINVVELPEGEYQVIVNGVATRFTWPPAE